MTTLMPLLLCAATLAAAAYVQLRVGAHTRTPTRAHLARLLLAVTGVAFGAVTAAAYAPLGPAPLVFLAGFGVVHVPAAVILALKRQRGR